MTQEPQPVSAEHDRRIDYIELGAVDLATVKRFYADVFGWQFTDYGPDYTSFADGRLSGGFRRADSVAPGGPLVVIFTTDLEAMQARVRGAGGRIVQPIFSFP